MFPFSQLPNRQSGLWVLLDARESLGTPRGQRLMSVWAVTSAALSRALLRCVFCIVVFPCHD